MKLKILTIHTSNNLQKADRRVPSGLFKSSIIIFAFILSVNTSCTKRAQYTGNIDLSKHEWLKNKKIFLDPGHGGKGDKDRFRTGPGGITEEEVNLNAALILNEMLLKAGADVRLSRETDRDISLDDRCRMADSYKPDLLISLHHNGTSRRMDKVNYPCVLIWGTKKIRPASYDFAQLLLKEFNTLIGTKGRVLSDFSIFHETGSKILRETEHLCPGIIGEAGFFSDEKQSIRLKDPLYIQMEAEAYFNAISLYFQRGIPSAEIHFSCDKSKNEILSNMIEDTTPVIRLKFKSGNRKKFIKPSSLHITLDNIPVRATRITGNIYEIKYGKKLYPGGHQFRFNFRNLRHQSSMILRAPFCVKIKKGDYNKLIKSGRHLLFSRRNPREGLRMLLSALSMAVTEPDSDRLLFDIAKGFRLIREYGTSSYYEKKIYYFYPDSKVLRNKKWRIENTNSYRFPVEYHGKIIKINWNSRPNK